jgi:spore coat protein U-like protein
VNRIAIAVGLLLLASSAHAVTTCRISRTGTLAFGPYDVMATGPTDSLLNVDVTCQRQGGPQNVVVVMRLERGNGPAVSDRRLLRAGGGGEYLRYGLFRDVGRSSTWGYTDGVDSVAQNLPVPNNGSATATFVIYGRIPAQQDVPIGVYTDSVQVTITP